ncbi:MAG TPA: hypothetical protein ENK61_00615 [Devosia sp.]|nr:hypothetical protein [Devosia sp.]
MDIEDLDAPDLAGFCAFALLAPVPVFFVALGFALDFARVGAARFCAALAPDFDFSATFYLS